MSRFEFHPVTREPYRQEPPERNPNVNTKLRATQTSRRQNRSPVGRPMRDAKTRS